MNVFLSWSGDTSKKIAEVLKNWLPSVIQMLKPFYSPDDISKGKRWSNEISEKLSDCDFGILIMTRENLSAPWIMFEGGALSKNISSGRVCTLLFGIKDTDIQGPLSIFQNTKFSRTDVYKLLSDINKYLAEKAIDNQVLNTVFDKMWPDFESEINSILETKEESSKTDVRSERELIEECVRYLRRMNFNHIRFDKMDLEFDRKDKVIFNKSDGNISFYEGKDELYLINISQLNTTAQVLDFIFQINTKGWCRPKHVFEFVNCLEELCDTYFDTNAQGVFCPSGGFMNIDWADRTYTELKIEGRSVTFRPSKEN